MKLVYTSRHEVVDHSSNKRRRHMFFHSRRVRDVIVIAYICGIVFGFNLRVHPVNARTSEGIQNRTSLSFIPGLEIAKSIISSRLQRAFVIGYWRQDPTAGALAMILDTAHGKILDTTKLPNGSTYFQGTAVLDDRHGTAYILGNTSIIIADLRGGHTIRVRPLAIRPLFYPLVVAEDTGNLFYVSSKNPANVESVVPGALVMLSPQGQMLQQRQLPPGVTFTDSLDVDSRHHRVLLSLLTSNKRITLAFGTHYESLVWTYTAPLDSAYGLSLLNAAIGMYYLQPRFGIAPGMITSIDTTTGQHRSFSALAFFPRQIFPPPCHSFPSRS